MLQFCQICAPSIDRLVNSANYQCILNLQICSVPAPLQLNTQHNRYFTLPVGRTAWSQQTITHDWGEGIMILLLPHASDGVTAL